MPHSAAQWFWWWFFVIGSLGGWTFIIKLVLDLHRQHRKEDEDTEFVGEFEEAEPPPAHVPVYQAQATNLAYLTRRKS